MKILGYATSAALCGPGVVIYGLLGYFGAALYGADTEGNILQNVWGNKYVQVCLNISIAGALLCLTKGRSSRTSKRVFVFKHVVLPTDISTELTVLSII